MKHRNILVTGGAGFIGSALVRKLVEDGHRVAVFDDMSRGSPQRLASVQNEIELIHGDIREPQEVAHALQGRDMVCHLAYVNGTRFFYEKPDLVLDVAVRGMLNVLDGCRQNQVPEMILASSSEVYQSPAQIPTPESASLIVPDPLNPRYSYGGGKIICELMALHWAAAFMPRVVIFRPHNVYGPDMGTEHVIPEMATRAAKLCAGKAPGETVDFEIKGDGQQTRAFVYIDDFIAGLRLVIEQGEHKQIYHIGSEEETKIADLAQLIVGHFGAQAKLLTSPAPTGETSRRVPDISKLRHLGYGPRIDLAQGLKKVIPWYADRI